MNEQDEKVLQMYLKDIKKKKIVIVFFIIFLILSVVFYGLYAKYKQSSSNMEISIQEEIKNDIINENTLNEETISNIENTTLEENRVDETLKENANIVTKEENTKEQTQNKTKENSQTSSKVDNSKKTNEKPANKDFLFTDGYTMENVTQAAQDYLKSYDFSGECVPIKDNEGVYLGMRVIFY